MKKDDRWRKMIDGERWFVKKNYLQSMKFTIGWAKDDSSCLMKKDDWWRKLIDKESKM